MRTRLLNFFFVCLLFISSGAAIKIKAAKGEQSKPKGTKGQKSSPAPTPAPTTPACPDGLVDNFKAVLEEASGRSVVVNGSDGWIGSVFTNATNSTSFEVPQGCFCGIKVLSVGGGAGGGRNGGGGGAGAVNECTIDEEDSKNGGTFVITVGEAGKGGTVGCTGDGISIVCPSGGDGGSTLITGPNGFSCEAAGGGGGGGRGGDGTAGKNSTATGGKGGHGGGGAITDAGTTTEGGAGGVPGGNVGGKGVQAAGGGGAGADDNGSDGFFDGNTCQTGGCLGGNGGNGTAVPQPFLMILQDVFGGDVHPWRNQTKVAAGGGGYGFNEGGMGGDGGGGKGFGFISFSPPCTDANPPYTGSGGGSGGASASTVGCDGAGGAITLVFIPCP